MPKTYISSAERHRAVQARMANGYSMAVKTCRARTGRTDIETARIAGISRDTLWALKSPENVQNVRFGTVRDVAKAVELSASDWLRLGGYES